ncbi:MAG: mechanosensitive ion channel [Deltaproteobacteria bacterium]|nr:mechanosensitive ion channel [Deltaproteobacteria bacterium]
MTSPSRPGRSPRAILIALIALLTCSRSAIAAPVPATTPATPEPATGLRGAMPDWLRGDVFGVEAWQVLGLALLVLVGVILRKLVIHLVVNYVRRITRKIGVGWIDHVVAKADGPIGTLVVAAMIALGAPALDLPAGLDFVVVLAVRTLAAFSVVWLLYRLVDVLSEILEQRAAKTDSKLDDQLVPLIRKSLKLFFVVVGAIFILQNLDVDVGSLLAGLGLGGLAFALAAKDTVANFFGSVMIFIDKPFQIGDWIVMSPGIEGTVEEVGFRTSRIRTFYNSIVTVPNANVTNTPVDNMGARRYRRYRAILALTYDTPPDKVEAFCEGVRELLRTSPDTRKDYFMVEFQDLGASSLDILLYCFFETPDWASELRARTRLNLDIMRLAASLGVDFAFPTQTLHIARTEAP